MDGLRKLPRASKSQLKFYPPQSDRLNAISIIGRPHFQCDVLEVPLLQAPAFLRIGSAATGGSDGAIQHTLKLLQVPTSGPDCILMGEQDFEALLKEVGMDPWIERLIQTWSYGYHHSGHIAKSGSASYYLGTGNYSAVWTTTYNGLQCATKGVILKEGGLLQLAFGLNAVHRIIDSLKLFQHESCSPLYLPFALSVDMLKRREDHLKSCFATIREIESITGHGSWGQGIIADGNPAGTIELTAKLGKALNTVANVYKHLNMVDLIWKHLEAMSLEMAGTDISAGVRASNGSIMEATGILRQQSLQARDQAQYLEVRIRSQSSVLFSLLTHNDAKVNIKVANASVELAAAARRDGSSMKTIAVLTMAFLPATFFAAFFSIPSLGWVEPDKFPLFWACTLPVTAATFMLWAGVTQRQAMRGLVRDIVAKRMERKEDTSKWKLSPRKTEVEMGKEQAERQMEELRRDHEVQAEDWR